MADDPEGRRTRFRVLLSTYNGSRFLGAQIESVLSQRDVGVDLNVTAADGRIKYEAGNNLGPARSYLTMLSETSDDIDYVALCDQDDVWIDGKLARAAEWLSRLDGPAMYCSAVEVVDAGLRSVGVHRTSRRGPALENALVQNIATGSTIVLNRSALRLFRQVPRWPVMHDWWIYAVMAAAGTVLYDPSAWVLYRQHGTNSIGLAASPPGQWARRLHQNLFTGKERIRSRQAAELLEILGPELKPGAYSTLARFVGAQASVSGRIGYALTGPAFRQRRVDDFAYRVLCVLGRI
jgi:glycosyltransferase involved in cell wall biosynthesis